MKSLATGMAAESSSSPVRNASQRGLCVSLAGTGRGFSSRTFYISNEGYAKQPSQVIGTVADSSDLDALTMVDSWTPGRKRCKSWEVAPKYQLNLLPRGL